MRRRFFRRRRGPFYGAQCRPTWAEVPWSICLHRGQPILGRLADTRFFRKKLKNPATRVARFRRHFVEWGGGRTTSRRPSWRGNSVFQAGHLGPRFLGRSWGDLRARRPISGRRADLRISLNYSGIRKFGFRNLADNSRWKSATLRHCVFRRHRRQLRRGFRPKTGSGIRCPRRARQGRGSGGDLFSKRPILGRQADFRISP